METIQKTKANNAVNMLDIYRTKNGVWCFNDEDLGIIAEPFVGEINTMIDMYARGKEELTVYISKEEIPNCTLSLTKLESEFKGMYTLNGTDIEGWLCPCLLNYFPEYVQNIYVRIKD